MSHLFLSYAAGDAAAAAELATALEGAGYGTWYYHRDSRPGVSHLVQTNEAIKRAVAVCLLISPAAVASYEVNSEVVWAYKNRKPFIPLLVGLMHEEFLRLDERERSGLWARCLGEAVTQPLSPGGVRQILPTVVIGLGLLGAFPAGALTACVAPRRTILAVLPEPLAPPGSDPGRCPRGRRPVTGARRAWRGLAAAISGLPAPVSLRRLLPPTLAALKATATDPHFCFTAVHVHCAVAADGDLWFEDDLGLPDRVSPCHLSNALGPDHCDLLTLMIDGSGDGGEVIDPQSADRLVRGLAAGGIGNVVMGWQQPVAPPASTDRAIAAYYGGLLDGLTVGEAVAACERAAGPMIHTSHRAGRDVHDNAAAAPFAPVAHGGSASVTEGLPPHNLPGLEAFVGRHWECAQIVRRLSDPLGGVLALTGYGGIGKTSLAVAGAERVAHRFPDGIVYVSAEAAPDQFGPEDVFRAMGAVARTPLRLTAEFEDGLMALRLASAERALLLILDNLESVSRANLVRLRRVVDSFGAARSRVILVQRVLQPEFESLAGLHVLPLPALDDDAGRDLVLMTSASRAAGGTVDRAEGGIIADEPARRVARACDGHPGLIRIAASKLATMSAASVISTLERLGPDLADRVGRLVEDVERALPRGAGFLLRHMVLFDPDGDMGAIRALCGAQYDAADARDALLGAALLICDERQRRFRVAHHLRRYLAARPAARTGPDDAPPEHGPATGVAALFGALVRLLRLDTRPRARAPGEQPDAPRIRLAKHYVACALRYNLALATDDEAGFTDALQWFGAEFRNLLAAGDVLHRAGDLAGVRDFGYGFDRALSVLPGLSHASAQLEARQLAAKDACRRLGDKAGEAFFAHSLGMLAHRREDYPAAARWYEDALRRNRRLNRLSSIASSLHQLGVLAIDTDNYPAAHERLEESLGISERIGDLGGQAATLHELGRLYRRRLDLVKARECCERSVWIRRSLGHATGYAKSLFQLGRVCQVAGERERAMQCFAECHAISHRLGDRDTQAAAWEALGVMAAEAGDAAGARALFDKARRAAAELGDLRRVREIDGRIRAL